MKKFIGIMMVMVFATVAMANPFSDVPFSHWSYDAVAKLSAKGIITGFPDGTFKGQRKVTRYELAMILARLLAKIDSGAPMNMSSDDKRTVEKLTVELADELSLLGVKVTALEDEVAVLKDDVAMIKEGDMMVSGGSGNGWNVSGEMVLDYNDFTYDSVTAAGSTLLAAPLDEVSRRGFRNFFYLNLGFKPNRDSKVFVQFFNNSLDWDATAGTDPGRFDTIKLGYLEMKNFDLFGLTNFNKATFGRQNHKVGNGLVMDARVDGVVMEANDFNFFMAEENAGGGFAVTPIQNPFNMWGFEYFINDEFSVYYSELRDSTVGAENKTNPYGFTYNSEISRGINLGLEYAIYSYDKVVAPDDGSANDDSFAAYCLNLGEEGGWQFAYTVREQGQTNGIYETGLNNDDTSLLNPLYNEFGFGGNVADMFLKYNFYQNSSNKMSVIYESMEANDVPAGITEPKVDVITLGYEKEIKSGVDMGVSYSMVSPEDKSALGVITDVNDVNAIPAGNFGDQRDETILKLQMRVKF